MSNLTQFKLELAHLLDKYGAEMIVSGERSALEIKCDGESDCFYEFDGPTPEELRRPSAVAPKKSRSSHGSGATIIYTNSFKAIK